MNEVIDCLMFSHIEMVQDSYGSMLMLRLQLHAALERLRRGSHSQL